ncbi:hypothetical protein [Breznakia pachnodae]|uniref:Uncharacterized protein n=1 Tax=Breznakia pachnodae TaxID=265178 RepID=A0ABU0E6F3_9FIRM|nr:hypothetical protein [Breznakia pachnodae]MDQ0362489.1 hypothetical protein [Breznakia pachnodae]
MSESTVMPVFVERGIIAMIALVLTLIVFDAIRIILVNIAFEERVKTNCILIVYYRKLIENLYKQEKKMGWHSTYQILFSTKIFGNHWTIVSDENVPYGWIERLVRIGLFLLIVSLIYVAARNWNIVH